VDQGASLLAMRYNGPPATAGRYLIVSDDGRATQELQDLLLASHRDTLVDVILVGEENARLSDDATVEEYVDVLTSVLGPVSEDEAASPAEANAIKELKRRPFRGVIFTAGMHDTGEIGERGFTRLLTLAQGLQKCGDALKALKQHELAEPPSLWVVTRGAYVAPIVPSQGTLQGLTTVLCSELYDLVTKHVDLHSFAELPALATLILHDAREKSYTIGQGGAVAVARFNAVEKKDARSLRVSASDKAHCFFADLGTGLTVPGELNVAFRLQTLPPPKDDEVTVDIHAAALNFRDVMIALSLLPEKSYERSYYGRNLGLEAAGIVSAVGKNVKDLMVRHHTLILVDRKGPCTDRAA
jgi:hypothetical protein